MTRQRLATGCFCGIFGGAALHKGPHATDNVEGEAATRHSSTKSPHFQNPCAPHQATAKMLPPRRNTRGTFRRPAARRPPLPAVGDRIEVLWEDRNIYFRGTLSRQLKKRPFTFVVAYDDGDRETVHLDDEYWRYAPLGAGGVKGGVAFEPGELEALCGECASVCADEAPSWGAAATLETASTAGSVSGMSTSAGALSFDGLLLGERIEMMPIKLRFKRAAAEVRRGYGPGDGRVNVEEHLHDTLLGRNICSSTQDEGHKSERNASSNEAELKSSMNDLARRVTRASAKRAGACRGPQTTVGKKVDTRDLMGVAKNVRAGTSSSPRRLPRRNNSISATNQLVLRSVSASKEETKPISTGGKGHRQPPAT